MWSTSPKFTHTITTSSVGQEQPLVITTKLKEIDFSIKYNDLEGANDQPKFSSGTKIGFRGRFPFMYPVISYSEALTIQLISKGMVAENAPSVLYSLSGKLTNLRNTSYKVRIIDTYGNLLDEKYVSLTRVSNEMPSTIESTPAK